MKFFETEQLKEHLCQISKEIFIFTEKDKYRFGEGRFSSLEDNSKISFIGQIPPIPLQKLGNLEFCQDHGVKYPYVAGSMANGISSVEIVIAMAKNGMLGFFGSAGLPLEKIKDAISKLSKAIPHLPYGFNLIHSPNESELEQQVVDLYIKEKVTLIEASAYLGLTLPVVHYRVHGIYQNDQGEIITPNQIMAKVSRIEVASKFFAPPPTKMLQILVSEGKITAKQAELARQIPMAQDITAESDSGGHTDNRPALTLFPTILALRDQMQDTYKYSRELRVGAGGGIATPSSALASFSMGADYLVTGSINQGCIESGTSDVVRKMLRETRQADITMAPSADMFEMGVQVQVLKRGTMFPMKGARLFELYKNYSSIEDIPLKERNKLEKTFFQAPLEKIWEDTQNYFARKDPAQIVRAKKDPKHKMALLFRWYLGKASLWANQGVANRKMDYQIWCGPAMGSFNEWTRGTFLEKPEQRNVSLVALNLLWGASVKMRLQVLRCYGVKIESHLKKIAPIESEQLHSYLKG